MIEFLNPRIELCFQTFKAEAEKVNEMFEYSEIINEVEFASGKIIVKSDSEIVIKKNDDSIRVEGIKTEISSPIYEMLNVAQEISNAEAKYCAFEYVGYMILYNRWDISRTSLSDATRIYTITDRLSGKEMNIATRGCAIPPGV